MSSDLNHHMSQMRGVFTRLVGEFARRFGNSEEESKWFFAPGRVNLIGEHIDYCGGLVLPATIEMGTYAIARKNGAKAIHVQSTLKPVSVSFSPDAISYKKEDDWGNYPKGVFLEYYQKGASAPGLDILYHGNLPGGGLSRSASLEVCTALIVEAFSGFVLDEDPVENRKKMALLCQKAENDFVGVNCGIMDQAAIALGKGGKATLLNCDTLELAYVPVNLGDYRLIIVDSKKSRELLKSGYNERREDVERALKIIQKKYPVKNLCNLRMEQLPEALALLTDTRLKKRVRHVVSENRRVFLAYHALRSRELAVFGRILKESHISLQEDYEVTGKELDCLFGISNRLPGNLGARMTGAGFGGCFIALVHKNHIDEYMASMEEGYRDIIGYPPECFTTSIGTGAVEIVRG